MSQPTALSDLLPGTAPAPAPPEPTGIQADTDWIADLIERYPHNEMMQQLGTRFGRVLGHLMQTEQVAQRATGTGQSKPAHEHHHHGNTYQDRRTVSAPTLNQHTEQWERGAITHQHVEVLLPNPNQFYRLATNRIIGTASIALVDERSITLTTGHTIILTDHEMNRLQTFFKNDFGL